MAEALRDVRERLTLIQLARKEDKFLKDCSDVLQAHQADVDRTLSFVEASFKEKCTGLIDELFNDVLQEEQLKGLRKYAQDISILWDKNEQTKMTNEMASAFRGRLPSAIMGLSCSSTWHEMSLNSFLERCRKYLPVPFHFQNPLLNHIKACQLLSQTMKEPEPSLDAIVQLKNLIFALLIENYYVGIIFTEDTLEVQDCLKIDEGIGMYSRALRARCLEKCLDVFQEDINYLFQDPQLEGSTTLLAQVASFSAQLISSALKKGANPNIVTTTVFGNPPLAQAIAMAANSCALVLIKEGSALIGEKKINLDLASAYLGNTPLILSVAKGHRRPDNISNYEISKTLLEHKANANIQDKNGNTALHIAVIRRDIESIKLLLSYGAKVAIKNNQGKKASDMLGYSYEAAQAFINLQTGDQPKFDCYSFPSEEAFNQVVVEEIDKLLGFEPIENQLTWMYAGTTQAPFGSAEGIRDSSLLISPTVSHGSGKRKIV